VATVPVDLEVYNYLLAQGLGGAETASSILRRLLVHEIELNDDLVAYLTSLAASPGKGIASILRRELHLQRALLIRRRLPALSFILRQGPERPRGIPPAMLLSAPWDRPCAFLAMTPSHIARIPTARHSRTGVRYQPRLLR
jgi:SeqA protein N-terminal domain